MNAQKRAAQPASILVVDDTPANLQVLAGMLKDRGHRVRPVPSGELALLAAQRDPPDLILLDINMPEMNGYEVCERLKADEKLKGIPVIFISALAEPLDKVRAFATGGVDYLTKPFQMEELHARVETHLKLRRLQIDLEEHGRRLEKARERIEFDLKLARHVQRSLLPQHLPQIPGYEFFSYYESAFEIGGDYYDFIPLPGPRVAVLLGDVSGKGVTAALLMAKLRADARLCMLSEADPAAAISKLNYLIYLINEAGIAGRFATLVAAVLDPQSHSVTLVNAGHPSPLIYRSATRTVADAIDGEMSELLLGAVDGVEYHAHELFLAPGDCLLAFTDGVTDATDDQDRQLQIEGVYAALEGGAFSPQALGERVVEAVKEFSAGRSQFDDVALVGFGRIVGE
jgi:phosphoserine phosphatase RsbU/P